MFRTKWETYAYQKMPFGLIKKGVTFERAKGMINRTIVIYSDDITIYSKKRQNHFHDLKQNFECCKKYGISLNPSKSYFIRMKVKFWGLLYPKRSYVLIMIE